MRRTIAAASAAVALCGLAAVAAAPGAWAEDTTQPAPLVGTTGDVRKGHYIVVLKDAPAGAADATKVDQKAQPVLKRLRAEGVRPEHRFSHALNGFSAELSADELAEVRSDPAVKYVSRDGGTTTAGTQSPTPSFGLDRIDSRSGLDDSYTYPGTGKGVTAYVIDSGIRSTHQEFAGRLAPGFAAKQDDGHENDTEDCQWHGTHVAGTLGGTTYGVAKEVTIVPIRTQGCNGSGWWSDSIAGIDWMVEQQRGKGPAVANYSVGSGPDGFSQDVEEAIQRAIDAGITFVNSAMNNDVDACRITPSRMDDLIVVGSVDRDDKKAWDSNWGSCLDIFAPGDGIESAGIADDTASAGASGTSMAAPHVAGVAALYLADHPSATPAEVTAHLLSTATRGVVQDARTGSPNLLLYQAPTGTAEPQATATTPAPPATVTGLIPQQRGGDSATDASVRPQLQLRNTGTSTVPLSDVTLRYWFTRDGGPATFDTACDWAVLGCANVRQKVVAVSPARQGADSYLEVSFTSGAGSLAPGRSTGELSLRLNKTNWSTFNETDDHSRSNASAYSDTTKVTVHAGGRLVAGLEP